MKTSENETEYVAALQTKITYLRACTAKLGNDLLRHELNIIDFEELQKEVEKTLESVKKDMKQ